MQSPGPAEGMWERDEEKTGIDGLTLWGMGGQQHGEPR
jgi:hypothetical protein